MKGANYVAQSLQFQNSTQEVNIVWSNTYMPPTYKLLRISERSRILKKNRKVDEFPSYFLYPSVRVNFHDLGGKVSLELNRNSNKCLQILIPHRLRNFMF